MESTLALGSSEKTIAGPCGGLLPGLFGSRVDNRSFGLSQPDAQRRDTRVLDCRSPHCCHDDDYSAHEKSITILPNNRLLSHI
jgi:hypothetical protein